MKTAYFYDNAVNRTKKSYPGIIIRGHDGLMEVDVDLDLEGDVDLLGLALRNAARKWNSLIGKLYCPLDTITSNVLESDHTHPWDG